jgi:hypothetical protein
MGGTYVFVLVCVFSRHHRRMSCVYPYDHHRHRHRHLRVCV